MKSKLYVYPTDTVWGIGGDIFSEDCYRKIAKIKGHDSKKPLSIVFKDFKMITSLINLPNEFNEKWLNDFFALESTIGVPKSWAKIELPSWICQESDFISIRCQNSGELSPIFDEVNGPITSTSLNITGQDPIVNFLDAKEFFTTNMKEEYFCDNAKTVCSGRSSTIVLYDITEIKVVREGKYIEEIKEHLKLLSA
ncbi:L-threonylcarbamoyladenylate synthase [Halobacteriovorax sp.]|uniref:L-threonylcarbamoyladenylate synthase n=1 Tax=Halobacteriovorax sp. TaxID=2020862 RepID=UPI00356B5E0E